MTAPQTPAPALPRALEARLLDLAAAWEDKATLQRAVAKELSDLGDRSHMGGQATGLCEAALDLRQFLTDLTADPTETPCNPE